MGRGAERSPRPLVNIGTQGVVGEPRPNAEFHASPVEAEKLYFARSAPPLLPDPALEAQKDQGALPRADRLARHSESAGWLAAFGAQVALDPWAHSQAESPDVREGV